MNRGLLDTSAYSAFKRGDRDLKHWVREASEILLSPVVLGELRAGFLKGSETERNLTELSSFLESPRVSVVTVDEETAERYAVILRSLRKAGRPIPTNDIWIAASAMQHGAKLVTCDPHFLAVSQAVVVFFGKEPRTAARGSRDRRTWP